MILDELDTSAVVDARQVWSSALAQVASHLTPHQVASTGADPREAAEAVIIAHLPGVKDALSKPQRLGLGLKVTQLAIAEHNANVAKEDRIPPLRQADARLIATVVGACEAVVNLVIGEEGTGVLSIWSDPSDPIFEPFGPSCLPEGLAFGVTPIEQDTVGLYLSDERAIEREINRYAGFTTARQTADIIKHLRANAPSKAAEVGGKRVPLKSQWLDLETKRFHDYTAEVAFTHKAAVDYIPDAPLTVFDCGGGVEWDIESHVRQMFTNPDTGLVDEECVALRWQLVEAILRPTAPWNQGVLVYNTQGNNGKSTDLLHLETLLGKRYRSTANLAYLSTRFGPQALADKVAVICSENLHGKVIDDSTAVKTCITGDATRIEPKGRPAYTVTTHYLVIQAANEFFRAHDDTGSFIRRWVMLPYYSNFNSGGEIRAVKSTLIVCREVLEYVVSRVVGRVLAQGPSQQFIQPRSGLMMLNEMRQVNDPVLSFAYEVLGQIVSPVVPVKFVYDVYVAWLKAVNPSAFPMSMRRFNTRLREHVLALGLPWSAPDKGQRPQPRCEPVIAEFKMLDYFQPGRSVAARTIPAFPPTAKCWVRS
jgi:phage/plasmid-associated DNA primase